MAAKLRAGEARHKGRSSRKRPAKKRAAVKAPLPQKRAVKKTEPGVVETALAVFAHEVRTPLTGILAISDLLATSDLPERERRWVDTIKTGAEHLASLTTLFVDAAKEAHKDARKEARATSAIRDDLFDLRALARSVGDSLAGRATAKGLQSEVDISDELPSLVVGDAVRLRAALENLIDNAVKFTEQGRVAFKAMPARAVRGKIGVAFAVSDSGIGLTQKEIKRLFRPFSQANVSIASRFGGAGLGLSSVKQLARAMGGNITVASHGGGATFTLTVKLNGAAMPPSTCTTADADGAMESMSSLRVLSVEDNPFGRVVLNTILSGLGHQTEFIGRGEDAAERVTQGTFDVVLMDMVLPGIDGIEAIQRIRALGPPHGRIALIGVSGRGEDEAAARGAGADAFLLKPVSPRALATALLEAIRHAAAATS